MTPLRSLAFVVNAAKAGAPDLAEDLMQLARDAGASVKETHAVPVPTDFLEDCDACCVIGGDGTLLGVARMAAKAGVPIIGVNRGSLGFLTTFTAEEAREQLPSLLAGDYDLSERALLGCGQDPSDDHLALNDVVIKDENHSRLTHLSVYANEQFVTTYTCDGLIIASPTGSTAYNLSAGGPLIQPTAEVIALTPICPHTLSNRSMIFHHDVCLRIVPEKGPRSVAISIDGQGNMPACPDGKITIQISPRRLKLVQSSASDPYAILRTKLKWTGGVTNGH
jgi:NAD+ kinase